MDIQKLKEHIIENNLIDTVLEELGCHHIRDKGNYISSANPDGDNPNAIVVYKDNLSVIDFTRDIKGQKDSSDIFDLVSFFEKCNFFESVKWVCSSIGIDIYKNFNDDLPETVQVAQMLLRMIESENDSEEEKPIKPLSENILRYFDRCIVKPFIDDGISDWAQDEFEIGYDQLTNRITIPIRDEYNTLVGIKGRWFGSTPEGVPKYSYIERCPKGRVLYGLHRAVPYITREKKVYVVESEKGVMQAVSAGYDNVVSSGGKQITNYQIEMLSRLCADVVLCFDQDVTLSELKTIALRFVGNVNVYAIIDTDGTLLNEKESPTDRIDVFEEMLDKCQVKLR